MGKQLQLLLRDYLQTTGKKSRNLIYEESKICFRIVIFVLKIRINFYYIK